MFSRSPRQAWLLALICALLLWARTGVAHLHLCFDGQEAPASLHLTHAEGHDAHHEQHAAHGESHSDLDVSLSDQALAKPAKPVHDLPFFLIAALCIALLGVGRAQAVPRDPPPALARSDARWRPPLRGPPLAGVHP